MPLSLKQLSKSQRSAVQTVGVFIASVFLFLLLAAISPLAEGAQTIQASFYQASQTIGSWVYETLFDRDSLRSEHAYYQNVAQTLLVDTAYTAALEREVQELKSMLDYVETVPHTAISARVLSRNLQNERTILIDKGTDNGLVPGQPVIISQGHLVGVITQTQRSTSRVRLLQDGESSIGSSILGSDKTIGLTQGTGGYLLSMDYIPRDQRIATGDVVVTSGLDQYIPSGLVIGIIDTIEADDAAAFQQASINPIIQTNDYSYVTILQVTP